MPCAKVRVISAAWSDTGSRPSMASTLVVLKRAAELFLTDPTWFNSTEEAIQAAAAVGFTVEKGTADYHG